MVSRVLIDTSRSAIRVSLPGYDAQSSSREYMAFDGAWRQTYGYRRGMVAGNANRIGTTNPYGNAQLFYLFGEVLSAPPLCKFHWSYTASPQGRGSGFTVNTTQTPPVIGAYADVQTDRVTFSIMGTPASISVYVWFMLIKV